MDKDFNKGDRVRLAKNSITWDATELSLNRTGSVVAFSKKDPHCVYVRWDGTTSRSIIAKSLLRYAREGEQI